MGFGGVVRSVVALARWFDSVSVVAGVKGGISPIGSKE